MWITLHGLTMTVWGRVRVRAGQCTVGQNRFEFPVRLPEGRPSANWADEHRGGRKRQASDTAQ